MRRSTVLRHSSRVGRSVHSSLSILCATGGPDKLYRLVASGVRQMRTSLCLPYPGTGSGCKKAAPLGESGGPGLLVVVAALEMAVRREKPLEKASGGGNATAVEPSLGLNGSVRLALPELCAREGRFEKAVVSASRFANSNFIVQCSGIVLAQRLLPVGTVCPARRSRKRSTTRNGQTDRPASCAAVPWSAALREVIL